MVFTAYKMCIQILYNIPTSFMCFKDLKSKRKKIINTLYFEILTFQLLKKTYFIYYTLSLD